MLSVLIPSSTRLTLIKLLRKKPDAASSSIDNAICVVARASRKREAPRAPEGWPDALFSVEIRSGRVLCSAGNSPKSSPVPTVSAAAYSMASGLTRKSIVCATCAGSSDMMKTSVHFATKSEARPPNAASRRDSVSSWPIRRVRLAPMESRTAISVARAAERASSRLAMLAHAISRTSPVTLSSR